jgi:hypothetical protein
MSKSPFDISPESLGLSNELISSFKQQSPSQSSNPFETIARAPQPSESSYDIDSLVKEASSQYNVDPALIHAVIGTESSGNAKATSPKGAGGLMQLMGPTAKDLGVQDVYDPKQNVMGGTKYLRQLLDRFKDPALAISAYHAGAQSVINAGNSIPDTNDGIMATRDYVSKVLRDAEKLRTKTAPTNISGMVRPEDLGLTPDLLAQFEKPENNVVPNIPEKQASEPGSDSGSYKKLEGPISPISDNKVLGSTLSTPVPMQFQPKQTSVEPQYQNTFAAISKISDPEEVANQIKGIPQQQRDLIVSKLDPVIVDKNEVKRFLGLQSGRNKVLANTAEIAGAVVKEAERPKSMGRMLYESGQVPFLVETPEEKAAADKFDKEGGSKSNEIFKVANVLNDPEIRLGDAKRDIDKIKEQSDKPGWLNGLGTQLEMGRMDLALPQMISNFALLQDNKALADKAISIYDKYKEVSASEQDKISKTNAANQLVAGTVRMLPGLSMGAAATIGSAIPVIGPVVGEVGSAWSTYQWAMQGAGDVYADMRKEGVSHDKARSIAPTVGLVYALVENLQFNQITNASKPVLDRIIKNVVLKKVLENGALKMIAEKGVDAGSEILEEAIQGVVSDVGKEIGKISQTGNTPDVGSILKQEWEVAKENASGAAGPMVLLSLFGLGGKAVKHYIDKKVVRKRWAEWLAYEKELMNSTEVRGDRIH